MIHGVRGQSDLIKTRYQPLLPPNLKSKRGRPKKLRRKSQAEDLLTCTSEGPYRFDSSQRTIVSQSSHGIQFTQKRQKKKKAKKDQTSRAFAKFEAFGAKAKSYARVEGTKTSVTCTAIAQSSWGVAGTTTETQVNYDFNIAMDGAGKGKEYQGRRNDALLGMKKSRPSSGGENSRSSLGEESDKTPRMKKPTITEVLRNIKKKAKERGGQ
ncbi:hypothetical protein CDL12_16490 [Handroanthus impetiginosus]|uniref:Uncharacterized protein n=1 Tax=Handroanthus impetiginosus TaxID=429701 RepID=A0A2G9H060_9LAMI|nr:hypothetical protein CDL12_16490 [Handroanthus impetiginosus]